MLYPLKFKPIYKHYVWGGKRMASFKNIKTSNDETISESWELSGVQGNVSVVANGDLKGNNLQELIEIYMGDLVGDKVYEQYGVEFPILFKFIDAAQRLSVQVHPNDEVAKQRHNAYGKEEMWYIIEAEKDAELCIGFKQKTDKEKFHAALNDKTLVDLLNFEKISAGDVVEVPAGRIHAICGGTLLAEIQETSDITYRVFDWGREYDPKTARQMHVDLALDVIDYNAYSNYKTKYNLQKNAGASICKNKHFNVNVIEFDKPVERDYSMLESFVVFMCVGGNASIDCDGYQETISAGETILIPAICENVKMIPSATTKLLEVSI